MFADTMCLREVCLREGSALATAFFDKMMLQSASNRRRRCFGSPPEMTRMDRFLPQSILV